MRQAVVLVGGLGTRLGVLTQSRPKPLLDVGGRPFLRWLVDELRRHRIDKIVLLAGFAGDQVLAGFGGETGITVQVEPQPLGTAGALRFAAADLDERFFLMNGDSLFDINLWDLAAAHSENAVGAMALRPVPDVSRYGAATLEQDRVVGFRSGGRSGPGIINGGVVLLSRAVLERIEPGRSVSLETEVYPVLAAEGLLRGRIYDRPFIDIGVPSDFERAQSWIGETLTRGAVIFDRDGVLNRDVGYAHRPDQIEWAPGAIEAVKAVNDAGLFAFVATNQAGVAHGYYGEADVRALHAWMNAELIDRGAHIDDFVHSPFHPAGVKAAYRRDAPCRKPKPGMVLDLLRRFPVDRSRAVMIGDKLSDVQAAEAAGIEGLLFEGGDLHARLAPVIAALRR